MAFVREEAKNVPVIEEADLCVLGGSCTGVFAAIRAARLGAKVVLVEQQNAFGGVATNSMVCVWHSLLDTEFKQTIIAGLTLETMKRLEKRQAVILPERSHSAGFRFNPSELKIELDEMVLEHGITPYLHTMFVAPYMKDGSLEGVFVENKSGRGLIKAKFFIDATGDGDLCTRAGLSTYKANQIQPSTTCAAFSRWGALTGAALNKALLEHGPRYDLPEGFAWGSKIAGSDVYMLAATRVYHTDCSDAQQLTRSEIEGRRQVRAIQNIINEVAPENNVTLQALPSRIGVRESRHVRCQYQLTGDDVLYGRRFEDAIANGSYRVDIHHQDKPGITFRYLDGVEEYQRPGFPNEVTRWREPLETDPTFYQIPFRSMVPEQFPNLLAAGRMIDADTVAHAGIRVMVNMNQTGEAAGVAAVLAMSESVPIQDLDTGRLRKTLADGGSVIL